MIVLDTSAIVALQDRRDRWYPEALKAVREEPGPFIVPLAILAEVDAVLSGRSAGAMTHVLGSVLDASLLMDGGEQDTARIAALMAGSARPRLTFADAAVVACAERTRGRVLTFSPDPYVQLARDGVVALVPAAS